MNTVDLLKQKLNLDKNTFANSSAIFKNLDYFDEKLLSERLELIKQTFNFDDEELKRVVVGLPSIIGFTKEGLNHKLDLFNKQFGFDNKTISMLVRSQPTLLRPSDETIQNRCNNLKQTFNLSEQEISKVVALFPTCLCLEDKKLSHAKDIFQKTFNMSDEEIHKIFLANPRIISFSDTTMRQKSDIFNILGFKKEYLLSYPAIFSSPAKNLDTKYHLFCVMDPNKTFLKQPWYMQSIEKSYARYTYLSSRQNKVKPSVVLTSERTFKNQYGANSDELMAEYSFDDIAKEYIEASYKMLELTGALDSAEDNTMAM